MFHFDGVFKNLQDLFQQITMSPRATLYILKRRHARKPQRSPAD